jgi:hypothetical protein
MHPRPDKVGAAGPTLSGLAAMKSLFVLEERRKRMRPEEKLLMHPG